MPASSIRNVAVIAHVDHGKTSLLDGLLRTARVFREHQAVTDCVMDRHDLERERGITIFSKACSLEWRGRRLNIIDTPGHADFGGEVERVLRMADAALVLVCAHDGPMPQTRFVLRKALAHGLGIVLVVNKVDRKDARPEEVPDEVLELLIDLGADESLLDCPVLFASAKERRAARSLEAYADAQDLSAVLDAIVEHVPPPRVDAAGPLQLGVCQLEWDDYVGRLALGRVERGALRAPQRVVLVRPGEPPRAAEVKQLYAFRGLERVEVTEAAAGDIVFLSGLEGVEIGDTVCDPERPDPLPAVEVDPPTVAMHFLATDSPFRGRDGNRITSRQLRERLLREARANVALEVRDTDSTDQLEVRGRGLLHLGILIEEMRREGYEFSVSRPKVIERRGETGKRLEPIERAQVDVTEEHSGKVIELMGKRRGELLGLTPRGDQVRLEFEIPARGLIGIRSPLLNATGGEATLSHEFLRYDAWRGPLPGRNTGVQVAMEQGKTTAYAVESLEARGQLFVSPGEEVYAGQIVGEHRRPEDIEVNVCRRRQVTNMRSATAERKVVLAAPRSFGVEEALAYLADDELLEVTPRSLRLRKRLLDAKARKRAAKRA
ncbi:MAG: translational GTPase TypA [Planctomycetota bacterium]|nr:MAG: translational GTPase TypA [Planctomycetota bacterium]